MDGSKRLFMEADIDPMGAKAILQEWITGRDTSEERFRSSLPAAGVPSGFKRMGGVQRRSRPS